MNDNVHPVFKPILDSLTECPSVGKSIGPCGEGRLPTPPSKCCDCHQPLGISVVKCWRCRGPLCVVCEPYHQEFHNNGH